METLQKYIPSRRMRILVYVLVAVFVELLVFHAGAVVGSHEYFEPGYEREWTLRAPGFGEVRLPHGFMMSKNGAVGVVERATADSIVLSTRDGGTQTVHLASTTVVVDQLDNKISASAVTSGARVIVLGRPQADGTIGADVIRILGTDATTTNTE